MGAVAVEGKGSSGSTVEQGSGAGAWGSSLSAGASGCTSAGEGDFGTVASRLAVSSRRKSREGKLELYTYSQNETLAFKESRKRAGNTGKSGHCS